MQYWHVSHQIHILIMHIKKWKRLWTRCYSKNTWYAFQTKWSKYLKWVSYFISGYLKHTHVDRQPFLSFWRFSWPQLDYPDDYPSKRTQKAHYLLLSSESSQNLFLCPASLSYLIYKDIMRMNLRVISDVPLSFSPKKTWKEVRRV